MASRWDRERDNAPYVQTFAYLQPHQRRRSRRVPRLGLACAAGLAVALVTWQSRPGGAPQGRHASLRTIVADPRLTTADVASAPAATDRGAEPTGPAVVSVDALPTDQEAPTGVTETPPVAPNESPQVAAVQGPEEALPIGPPAPQPDVAKATPAHGNRTPRARSPHGSSVYAIRRLLDRYAVQAESGQSPAGARDMNVQVRLLSIREDGNRAVVRFTRRHRYRDALGRLVLKDTPPMETTVVKTAEATRGRPAVLQLGSKER